MKYSNELKVGIALVVTILIFYIGFRYLQDLPFFKGTTEFFTTFDDAGGLVSGNAVRINGVVVGAVDVVRLVPGDNVARVRFHLDRDIVLPHGSTTSIGGVGALGVVRMAITLGTDTTYYQEGDTIPRREETGMGALTDVLGAPIANQVDSMLTGATATLSAARTLMTGSQDELRQTLLAVQGSAVALNDLLIAEQDRLSGVLDGVAELTGNLNAFTGDNGDSLRVITQSLTQSLNRLDRTLASLESTTAGINSIIGKIENGEGTLGLLINDPSLYHQLDSTLASLNRILLDFQQNPKRYLKDLKIVDVF